MRHCIVLISSHYFSFAGKDGVSLIRRDAAFILKQNWTPKVPSEDVMKAQLRKSYGKHADTVRMAAGRVTIGTNQRESEITTK